MAALLLLCSLRKTSVRCTIVQCTRGLLVFTILILITNSMGGMTQRPWTPTKRRGPIAAEFKGPGPACVLLQSTIGKKTSESKTERSPAFSFGARHNGKIESIGPGPGQYNVTGLSAKGKDTPPSLSLHGRPKDPKPDKFPAPGDYDPDKAERVIHEKAPKYTFGLKTNVEKPLDTPAPNAYKPLRRTSSHRYSFGRRTPIQKVNETPAPNVYDVPKADKVLLDKAPKYSFGVKADLQKPFDTPAPNVYDVPKADKVLLDKSPKYSFGVKADLQKPFDTPAPNVYDVPKADKVLLDKSPKYSFGVKADLQKPFDTPAPNEYNTTDEVLHEHAPKFSFGSKVQGAKPLNTPAPNVYNIPSVVGDKSTPAYTISGRNKELVDERVKNPAPGQYNNVDPEHYKTHSPAYTMGSRVNIPKEDNIPGPGVYSPEKCDLDFSQAHSFGIRHSQYADHY